MVNIFGTKFKELTTNYDKIYNDKKTKLVKQTNNKITISNHTQRKYKQLQNLDSSIARIS